MDLTLPIYLGGKAGVTLPTKKNPRLTVLMAVHNGSKHLKSAIQSVLKQSLENFEFLIIDDGSHDDSVAIIQGIADPRIRLLKNKKNIGLAASLNRGLSQIKSEFIARMDDDDLCLPQRFKKQLLFLNAHPHIDLCGTWIKTFGRHSPAIRKYPENLKKLQAKLCFESPLAHPTVMFRRIAFQEHKLQYNIRLKRGQDFDLWDRAAKLLTLANIPEVLLKYREYPIHTRPLIEKRASALENIIYRRHLKTLGLSTSPPTVELFQACAQTRLSVQGLVAQETFLCRLAEANNKKKLYPSAEFQQELALRWYILCRQMAGKQMALISTFKQSRLFEWLQRPTYKSTALSLRHFLSQF